MSDEWWDYTPTCTGLDWQQAHARKVLDAIVGCLNDCGVPLPDNLCVTRCPPIDRGNTKCCSALYVWPEVVRLPYSSGVCQVNQSEILIRARLLRCARGKNCDADTAALIDAALDADEAVMVDCVPKALHDCCGGLPTQNIIANRICSGCEGVEVAYTIRRQYEAVPLGAMP